MRRVRLPLIAFLLVGALAASTGCGATADTTAATLGDQTISVATIDSLAADVGFMTATQLGTPNESESVMPGSLARSVLSFEIQRAAWMSQAERFGLSVEDVRADVQSQLEADPSSEGLGREARSSIVEFVAARSLVSERLAQLDPDSEADLRTLYDSVPVFWERACFSGLSAPSTESDAVADQLADGRSLKDIAESVTDGQFIAPSDSNCAPSFALPGELRDAVESTATGSTTGAVLIAGGDGVVVLRVDERRSLSFSDAREELAAQVGQFAGEQGPAAWISLIAQSAQINPRYGSGMASQDDGQGGSAAIILPPPTPVQPVGAPVAAQSGTSSDSATDTGQ